MYEAKFELEAVTPIFMHGADQTKAEIRSSSIKGLMRWWFRALAHGVLIGNFKETEQRFLKELSMKRIKSLDARALKVNLI